MFSVSGSTWVSESAQTHATEMLTQINSLLAAAGISYKLKASMANVVWWICLGVGYLRATYDDALSAAKNSLDPALCDDDQVLNLMPIAGITRDAGSYSTLVVQFTADNTGMTVPAGTHVIIANADYRFIVDVATEIAANSTVNVNTTCDTVGAIQVLSNQVTGTVESLAHIITVANSSSAVTGSDPETITHVRNRIISGNTISCNLNGLKTALEELDGIQYANCYFNQSSSSAITLSGGISLAARTLLMVVKGASTKIASTYAARSMAATQGSQSQQFVTNSSQTLQIKYENATTEPVYVKVYVDSTKDRDDVYIATIYSAIVGLADSVQIGTSVTQELILSAFTDYTHATILGAEVSLDGITYGRVANVSAIAIATFSDSNISIVLE